jgi:hypothetical protein
MREVSVSFEQIALYKKSDFTKLHHAANHAILLADWCKDQGLIMGRDFEWAVWKEDSKINFKFFGQAEKYATMFSLRFGDGSV